MYTKIKQVIDTKLSDNSEYVMNQDMELTGTNENKVIQDTGPTETIETKDKL